MKYMTFHASCSYAGLANLLSFYGVDTEDRKIALQMRLPYLFACEDGMFLSGPMLQGAEWFNLYLNPIGFTLQERLLNKNEVCACLAEGQKRMLGLRVSPENKHAVIFLGQENGQFHFLNNKREDSSEPETLCLAETDLLARLDNQVIVGTLESTAKVSVDYRSVLEKSLLVFKSMREQIAAFCLEERSEAALQAAMNGLFRPILLDGITMLELLERNETVGLLKTVQRQFLKIIRENRPAVLACELDMRQMYAAMTQYEELIIRQMNAE